MKIKYLILILFTVISPESMHAMQQGPMRIARISARSFSTKKVMEGVMDIGLGTLGGTGGAMIGGLGGAGCGLAVAVSLETIGDLVAPRVDIGSMRRELVLGGGQFGGAVGGLIGAAKFGGPVGLAFGTGAVVAFKYLEHKQLSNE